MAYTPSITELLLQKQLSKSSQLPGFNPAGPNPQQAPGLGQKLGAASGKLDSFINTPGGGFLMNLLAQQGYSTTPQSPLGAVGRAALQNQKQQQLRGSADVRNRLFESQIGVNQSRAAGGVGTEAPSKVRTFKYFESLADPDNPDKLSAAQERFLAVQRAARFENIPGAGAGPIDAITGELDATIPESTIVGGTRSRAEAGEAGKQEATTEAIPERDRVQAALTLPEDLAKIDTIITKADTTIAKIDEAVELSTAGNVGLDSALRGDLPGMLGGGPRKLKMAVKSLQAEFGFDTLTKMRAASKSGGALGQVSERELDLLINALRSIDIEGEQDVLKQNLADVKKHYQNYQNEMRTMKGLLKRRAGEGEDFSSMTTEQLQAIADGDKG